MESFSFDQLAPAPAPEPIAVASLAPSEPPSPELAAEAAAIVAAAHAEAQAIRESAHEQGFDAGFAAGMEAARAQLAPAAQALGEALQEAQFLREQALDAIEREAVELGLHVAQKALSASLEVQPERVCDAVRGALRLLIERERVVVQVNPGDLELVRDAVESLTAELGGIEHLDVQEERRVGRGGAILRTAVGEVDASLETKLQRAREVLVAELRG